jgi:hypothetical protein
MLEHSKSEQKALVMTFKPSVLMLQQRPSMEFHRGSAPAYSHLLVQSTQDSRVGQKSRQYGQEAIRKKAPTPKTQRVVRTPSGTRSQSDGSREEVTPPTLMG